MGKLAIISFAMLLVQGCAMSCDDLKEVYSEFAYSGIVIDKGKPRGYHGRYVLKLSSNQEVLIDKWIENQWAVFELAELGDSIRKELGTELTIFKEGEKEPLVLPYKWECSEWDY